MGGRGETKCKGITDFWSGGIVYSWTVAKPRRAYGSCLRCCIATTVLNALLAAPQSFFANCSVPAPLAAVQYTAHGMGGATRAMATTPC